MPTRYLSAKADQKLIDICESIKRKSGASISRSGAIEALYSHWIKPDIVDLRENPNGFSMDTGYGKGTADFENAVFHNGPTLIKSKLVGRTWYLLD